MPFSEKEHVQLLADAAGLTQDHLRKATSRIVEALDATSAKDITVAQGQGLGSKVVRVQADLVNHDIRLEAAEKVVKLFDLYPKKGSVTVTHSQVMINPKFVKKSKTS